MVMIFILMYSMYTSSLCQNCCKMHKQLSADIQPLLRQWGSYRSALINVPYRSEIRVKYRSVIEVPL